MSPKPAPRPDALVRPADLTPRRAIISGFIAFHIAAVIIIAMPPSRGLLMLAKHTVDPYLRLVGLSQSWPMFSPNPPAADTYLLAEVIYRDGFKSEWKFPIPADYSLTRRYTIERFRKWANDNVRPNTGHSIWPDAARYVARVNDTRGVPPDTIKLYRYWSFITSIDSGPPKEPMKWEHSRFFTYTVKPADLR
jgi:hypothetical protein